jgi:hypothetical protein
LRFLQGAGADGDDTSWFRKRIFITEVSLTATKPFSP